MPDNEAPKITAGQIILGIVNSIIWVAAIVLSFICNGGFDPFHFIAACCCPWCYLPFGIFCVVSGKRKGSASAMGF